MALPLKVPRLGVEGHGVTVCAACGLPAPVEQTRCGFCDAPLPAPLPAAFRAEVAGATVLLHAHGAPICVARRSGSGWAVVAPDGTDLFRLSPVTTASGTTLGVTDHRDGLIGTVRLKDNGDRRAEVRDGSGETLAAAYTGGPTDLHVVGALGRALGLVSIENDGADVLLTENGLRLPTPLVIALAVGTAAPAQVRTRRG